MASYQSNSLISFNLIICRCQLIFDVWAPYLCHSLSLVDVHRSNSTALELWNGKKLSDLWSRDFSPMSDTARTRVSYLLQQLQTGTPVQQWTFYPQGAAPVVMQIRHLPLAIADRPYTCFFCQGWTVEGVDPDALRGVEAVHHTPNVVSVYEWLAPSNKTTNTSNGNHRNSSSSSTSPSPPLSPQPHVGDPRGRPLMRNTAALKIFGPIRSDMSYTLASSSSGGLAPSSSSSLNSASKGGLAGLTRAGSGLSISSNSGDNEYELPDPEFQLGRTFADQSQVNDMVDALMTEGRWTCDEVPIRVRRRNSFSSSGGDTTAFSLSEVTNLGNNNNNGPPDRDFAGDRDVRFYSYDARLTTDPVTGNAVVLVNAVDVSERRKMQRLLEKAKQEAEAANTTKSLFLANISHDLRTPSECLGGNSLATTFGVAPYLCLCFHNLTVTGVLGVVDLLRSYPMGAEQMGLIDTLSASAEILLALVNDLLDFSKIEAGQLSLEQIPYNLPKLLADVMDLLRPRALGKGLLFSIYPELSKRTIAPQRMGSGQIMDGFWSVIGDPHRGSTDFTVLDRSGSELKRGDAGWLPATLIGDSTRLKQVLFNLIGNAIKFTEHGSVQINVEFVVLPDHEDPMLPGLAKPAVYSSTSFSTARSYNHPLDSPSEQPGNEMNPDGTLTTNRRSSSLEGANLGRGTMRVGVKDSGIGLTPQQIGNLFQPFSQGDNSMTRRFGGTGLGLAISRKLVELMGGEIGVNSTGEGMGSEFWFEIPVMFVVSEPGELDDTLSASASLSAAKNYFLPAVSPVEAVSQALAEQVQQLAAGIKIDPPSVADDDSSRVPSLSSLNLDVGRAISAGQLSAGDSHLSATDSLSVTSPKSSGSFAASGSISPITPPANVRPLRCLVAEDNKIIQSLLTRFLTRMGHTVTMCSDGKELLDTMEAMGADKFDVVISDVQVSLRSALEARLVLV